MATKLPQLQTFMTKVDEENFSKLLKAEMPQVCFMDAYAWDTPEPQLRDSVHECYARLNSSAIILNTAILDLDVFRSDYIGKIKVREEYHPAPVGKGLIQFLHSKQGGYVEPCLSNGRVAASYDPIVDSATDAMVKAVWKLLKKHGKKVYWVDRDTRQLLMEKPDSYYIAWPDAAKEYNGENGRFLTGTALAFFLTEEWVKRPT